MCKILLLNFRAFCHLKRLWTIKWEKEQNKCWGASFIIIIIIAIKFDFIGKYQWFSCTLNVYRFLFIHLLRCRKCLLLYFWNYFLPLEIGNQTYSLFHIFNSIVRFSHWTVQMALRCNYSNGNEMMKNHFSNN